MKLVRRRTRKTPRRTVGAVPGTLQIDPEAPPTTVRVMAYGPDGLEERDIDDLEDLPGIIGLNPVTWVNVDGLGDRNTLTRMGELFNVHPLALEDVVNVPQRSKVEEYGEHLFVVTRMAFLEEHLDTEQVSLFLGKNFVLTFQERAGDCLDPVRDRIRKGMGRIRKAGADYLAYALLDAVIDGYFPVLERYGEHLQELEELVISTPDSSTVARVNAAKRGLLSLRRAIWPQREVTNALMREDLGLFSDVTRLHLRDCYDHVVQIIDTVETYREIASGLLDIYQTNISNRMNEVMKVLTIVATIFIPLGFLAGVWGMNFNTEASRWNMPELNWTWGYRFALILMATIAVVMLLFFRRKGWLGSSPPAGVSASKEER